ncbi:MAG: alpha/beta hydrolase [Alphaproteobacteria bacterium]|nr:alpha/beta hydrolase [Alphaproteobacteria bacterium]
MADIFDQPEFVSSGGVKIAVYRDGPDVASATKPPVIFMHGFPELARSFRHQMAGLASAGYPVFAPDMRGYNRSDKPKDVSAYGMPALVGDMRAILDHFGIAKAVFVGHDLGAFVLWALPFYMPERLLGCAGLSYPLLPRLPINPLWGMRLLFHRKMYMLQFQKEGRCEPVLEADVERTMRFMMRKVGDFDTSRLDMSFKGKALNIMEQLEGPEQDWIGEPLMDEAEFQIYVDTFREHGFTAPIHWYRNLKANWKDMKRFLVKGKLPFVDLPCLIITAQWDFATPPRLSNGMHKLCGPLDRVDLADCSHWLQMERPAEVTDALRSWLEKRFG